MAQVIPIGMQAEIQGQVDLYISQRVAAVLEVIVERTNLTVTNEVMDVKEACTLLKCTVPTLNKYVRHYGLKRHKAENKVYYLRRECIEFIANLPS